MSLLWKPAATLLLMLAVAACCQATRPLVLHLPQHWRAEQLRLVLPPPPPQWLLMLLLLPLLLSSDHQWEAVKIAGLCCRKF